MHKCRLWLYNKGNVLFAVRHARLCVTIEGYQIGGSGRRVDNNDMTLVVGYNIWWQWWDVTLLTVVGSGIDRWDITLMAVVGCNIGGSGIGGSGVM